MEAALAALIAVLGVVLRSWGRAKLAPLEVPSRERLYLAAFHGGPVVALVAAIVAVAYCSVTR